MGQRFASKAPLAGRGRTFLKRFALASSLAALSLAAAASPAGAAVTIGQTGVPSNCTNGFDWLQPTANLGNAYVVPATGGIVSWTITSWSHNARAADGQMLAMKVFRKVTDPTTYMAVAHDGPRPLNGGVINTFTGINVPVRAGDLLGLHAAAGTPGCLSFVLGETPYYYEGNLADGQQNAFTAEPSHRLNIAAVITPANSFTLGKAKRNKKKGTATLTVDVPNPGELTGSGKGVKVAGAAVISKTVTAPGEVKLKIRAKGKKKATLNETGKVKVKPKVTFTPTGGDPSTQSRKLKLKKR